MSKSNYHDCSDLLEKALNIAIDAHRGQKDKGGMPYIFHPIRVAERCVTKEEKIVALLHDTIEDTYVTPEMLAEEGYSQRIIDAVLSVSRHSGETYADFVRRAAQNEIGKRVKLHDIEDNMDITRLCSIEARDIERLNNYAKGYKFLKGEDE